MMYRVKKIPFLESKRTQRASQRGHNSNTVVVVVVVPSSIQRILIQHGLPKLENISCSASGPSLSNK